ncbi:MAG: acetolactate synthase-1/2/3 large subunit [Gammaproteobacteria bacterium]|jgi:acetolactate synthase-1/2/3 large subunit
MTTTISGADALIRSLLDADTDVVFGYPGGAIMPVYDALYRIGGALRHVLVRHEQGATHAAQGYARTTGKTGVCVATSGPGATNFVTGLADALMDSTPLVCITGQVAASKLGSDAFQEADVVGLTLQATKWSCQVTDPNQVAPMIARAFEVAREGRPGPVLVDITRDAQTGLTSGPNSPPPPWNYAARHHNLSALNDAAQLINNAERPMMMVGHGVTLSRAEEKALAVGERAGLPMACTLLGLSAIPTAHAQYVGMLGMHGNYAPNLLTNEADVILAVGMRFDDRVTGRVEDYARQAKIIHVDVDPAQVNRLVKAECTLIADASEALDALLPLLDARRHDEWMARFHQFDALEHEAVIAPELAATSVEMRMSEVIDQLSEMTAGDAILVTDVGQHQMIAARHYQFSRPAGHITSGGLGTMGFALPAAIGAAIGVAMGAAASRDTNEPDGPARAIIAIAGDGGVQMTIQELGTLMQEQLPVKVIVLNNERLGMVRQWQELFFEGRLSEVHLNNPDFAMIARGYGIAADSISARDDLGGALRTMLDHPGPYFLEVKVGCEDNVFPIIPAGASVSEMRLR